MKGRNFRNVKSVTVGGQRVISVRVVNAKKLLVRTPGGFPGKAPLVVRTKGGGASKKTAKTRFRFVDHVADTMRSATTNSNTVIASNVAWVTGGVNPADPQGGTPNPWVVGVGQGGAVPSVGQYLYVPPGTAAAPEGLAGKVTLVSTQGGGITAVTVSPSPLHEVFSRLQLGGATNSTTGAVEAMKVKTASSLGFSFAKVTSGALDCKKKNGATATLLGEVSLRAANITHSFDFDSGNLFRSPSLNAWVRGDLIANAKVTAEAGMACSLKASWQNAHRKVFVFPYGVTLSFAPEFKFKVDATGTLEIEQRAQWQIGVDARDGRVTPSSSFRAVENKVKGAAQATVNAVLDAGVSVQFGMIDRIGIEAFATLNGEAKLTVKNEPAQLCIRLFLGLKVGANLFLDVWIARIESPDFSRTFRFAELNRCTDPVNAARPVTRPQVTTGWLPAATVGQAYQTTLATADNRNGSWRLSGGSLPTGLTLNAGNGSISGTPSGIVRQYDAVVTFTDGTGQSATAPIHVLLNPGAQVGGGSVQATLTWGNFTDLDVHVIDPSGEEIYYLHRESASGGRLDRDANAACGEQNSAPIENIFWPANGAPNGSYKAFVRVYSACSQSDLSWRLVVRVGGQVIIDQTGSGNSADFPFTVNNGVGIAQVGVEEAASSSMTRANVARRQAPGRGRRGHSA